MARLGEDVTVKRYKRTGSLIELLAENPDYPNIKIGEQDEDFSLEGLAVGLVRAWT